jgi:hypothetical protein
MIFNRTKADVDEAKKIRAQKVQHFDQLTDDEINTLERGMMTINALNRIEQAQDELVGLLNGVGYWNISIENKAWQSTDIFDSLEFQRILDNTNILKKAFLTYRNTPRTPNISYRYDDINALEKILYDLNSMVDDIEENYRECGNFECGEG